MMNVLHKTSAFLNSLGIALLIGSLMLFPSQLRADDGTNLASCATCTTVCLTTGTFCYDGGAVTGGCEGLCQCNTVGTVIKCD